MIKIIIGLIIVVFGTVMVFKSEWFFQNFGSVAWAEENLGTSGGSRLFYKLLGLALIFVGMLVATNLMTGFLMATLGKLFVK